MLERVAFCIEAPSTIHRSFTMVWNDSIAFSIEGQFRQHFSTNVKCPADISINASRNAIGSHSSHRSKHPFTTAAQNGRARRRSLVWCTWGKPTLDFRAPPCAGSFLSLITLFHPRPLQSTTTGLNNATAALPTMAPPSHRATIFVPGSMTCLKQDNFPHVCNEKVLYSSTLLQVNTY